MKRLLLFLVLLTMFSVNVYADSNLTTSLQHFYTFNDDNITGTTLEDERGNQDGTLTGSPTTGVSGKFGEAAYFDVTAEYVDFATPQMINDGTSASTVCSWMNLSSLADGETSTMGQWRQASGTQMILFFSNSSGTNYVYGGFRNAGTAELSRWTWTYTDFDNEFAHYCYVYDGGTKATSSNHHYYINGVEITAGQTMVTSGGEPTSGNFIHHDEGGSSIDGDMTFDEYGIWRRALTVDDVNLIYNGGTGLAYPFDATGLTITNVSIDPTSAFTLDNLTGYCEASDPDNTTLLFDWKWYRDGAEFEASQSSTALANDTLHNLANQSSTNTTKGESWEFECTVSDGTTTVAQNSSAVTIQNSVPTFDTQCPNTVLFHNVNLGCDNNASDSDADTLTYFTNDTRILLNSSTGRATDDPALSDYNLPGGWDIRINVTDGESWTEVAFNYSINDSAPATVAPRIDPSTPDNSTDLMGYCNATDPESDPLQYHWEWYKNGTLNDTGVSPLFASGLEVNVDNITSAYTEIGETWTLRCAANDTVLISDYFNATANISSTSVTSTNISAYNYVNFDPSIGYDVSGFFIDYNCYLITDTSGLTCANTSHPANTTSGSISCTADAATSTNINMFVSCNSTDMTSTNINSATESFVVDTVLPTATQNLPSTLNTTEYFSNESSTFNYTASDDYLNECSFQCINSSATLFSSYNTGLPTIFYFQNLSTLSANHPINCFLECSDLAGNNLTTIESDMAVADHVVSNFPALADNKTNGNFNVIYNLTFFGGSTTCNTEVDHANVTCGQNTTTSNTSTTVCTVAGEVSTIVNASGYCESTLDGFFWNSTTPTFDFWIDNVDPVISDVTFTDNMTWFNQNITGQFTFSDSSNLFRWNVSVDGVEIDSDTNVAYDNITYNLSLASSTFSPGQHQLTVLVADGHTAKSIPDYDVDDGWFFDDDITFKHPNGGEVTIWADDKQRWDSFNYEKKEDRYEFSFLPEKDEARKDIKFASDDPKTPEDESKLRVITFKVKTKDKPHIVKRPNMKYGKWIVAGNQWIDFYNPDSFRNDMIDMYEDKSPGAKNTIVVKVYYKGSLSNRMFFHSIGDVNIVEQNFTFYTVNSSVTYTSPIAEGTTTNIILRMDMTGTPYGFNNVSASLLYNGLFANNTKTSAGGVVSFTAPVTTPNVTVITNVSFNWTISLDSNPTTTLNFTQEVTFFNLTQDCSAPNIVAIDFCGYDEVTLLPLSNYSLNINLEMLDDAGQVFKEFGFEYPATSPCHAVCILPNATSTRYNAKMEYISANYTDRKYYIRNSTLSSNNTQNLSLFLLSDALASDVTLIVYNKNTGERIEDAFIKILRYYPGLDEGNDTVAYRTVEVERSDRVGETLGKMVLGDVWYKFIVEKPANTILLDSDIEKILSVEKLLAITTETSSILTYNELLDMNGDVTCTRGTQTCRFTWSNPDNTNVNGRLRVFQDTGITKLLLNEQTATSPAATLTFVIPGNTSGKRYVAEGWIDT